MEGAPGSKRTYLLTIDKLRSPLEVPKLILGDAVMLAILRSMLPLAVFAVRSSARLLKWPWMIPFAVVKTARPDFMS